MGRMKKILNNIYITGIADKGMAVGRTESGEVIFVRGAVPGDTVDVLSGRRRKGVRRGKVHRVVSPSPDRVEPVCTHFENCGGCKWQNLAYERQLQEKETVVKDAIERLARVTDYILHPIMGMKENPYHYRNKMEYTFTDMRWLTEDEIQSGKTYDDRRGIGLHKPGAYDQIIDIRKCWLQDDLADEIRNKIRDFTRENDFTYFHPRTQEGLLRNLIIKRMRSGQVMVIVVYAFAQMEKMQQLHAYIRSEFAGRVTSLYYMINEKKNDSLSDIEAVHVAGEKEINEKLGDKNYAIGPKSFFQTNTNQAERLYERVKSLADLKETDTVYDLYTGLGSIALYLADHCDHIIGIEEIPEAIEDARKNANLNNIDNCTFYAGDVKDVLQPAFAERHKKSDVIITDPPRAGMHEEVVKTIVALKPRRIVYVSCNPATCARDIKRLGELYKLTDVQAIDMFPQTHHIECVTKLELRNE